MLNVEDNTNKNSATDGIAGGAAGEFLQSGARKERGKGIRVNWERRKK